MLETPAMLDELGGEPIQERGMRRAIAFDAELAGSADDAFAKMVMPHAIDDHARSERIVRIGEHVRECGATPAVRDLRRRGINDLQKARRNFFARLIECAFGEHESFWR